MFNGTCKYKEMNLKKQFENDSKFNNLVAFGEVIEENNGDTMVQNILKRE